MTSASDVPGLVCLVLTEFAMFVIYDLINARASWQTTHGMQQHEIRQLRLSADSSLLRLPTSLRTQNGWTGMQQ